VAYPKETTADGKVSLNYIVESVKKIDSKTYIVSLLRINEYTKFPIRTAEICSELRFVSSGSGAE
jgi:hypothetical protein